MASEWYVRVMGEVIGPMEPLDLREMVQRKRIATTDEVRRGTEGRWSIAGDVKGLFPSQPQPSSTTDDVAMEVLGVSTAAPPRAVAPTAVTTKPCPMCREPIMVGAKKCKHCGTMLGVSSVAYVSQESELSKWTAFVLCLFLGELGAHQFYSGNSKRGWIMLAMTCTGVGLLATVPWKLVDLRAIFSGGFEDADGKVLSS